MPNNKYDKMSELLTIGQRPNESNNLFFFLATGESITLKFYSFQMSGVVKKWITWQKKKGSNPISFLSFYVNYYLIFVFSKNSYVVPKF